MDLLITAMQLKIRRCMMIRHSLMQSNSLISTRSLSLIRLARLTACVLMLDSGETNMWC